MSKKHKKKDSAGQKSKKRRGSAPKKKNERKTLLNEMSIDAKSKISPEEREIIKKHTKRLAEQQDILKRAVTARLPVIPDYSKIFNFEQLNIAQRIADTYTQSFSKLGAIATAYQPIFDQLNAIADIQKQILEKAILPIEELNKSVLEASNAYTKVISDFNANILVNILEGLIFKLSFQDHIEQITKNSRVLYDYNEKTATYEPEANLLKTDLDVTNEFESGALSFRQTRSYGLELSFFTKDC